jgi:ArsR family transcriptional regulator, lead/cadmium/zinc/bismuth-responsive transcriptional repressor
VTDPIAPTLELATEAVHDADDVDGWAELFRALSDPNRLRILLAVHRAPGINVSDLAVATGMTDNAASHALNALRVRGLVMVRRHGRERHWSLTHPEVHELLHRIGATHSPLHPAH